MSESGIVTRVPCMVAHVIILRCYGFTLIDGLLVPQKYQLTFTFPHQPFCMSFPAGRTW